MHTEEGDADVKHMRRKLELSIGVLRKLEAESYHGDEDRPNTLFGIVLDKVVRQPIQTREQLDTLFMAIDYLMSEGPEPLLGGIDEAIESAIAEAIQYASNRDKALLALARYRLRGPRRDLMHS